MNLHQHLKLAALYHQVIAVNILLVQIDLFTCLRVTVNGCLPKDVLNDAVVLEQLQTSLTRISYVNKHVLAIENFLAQPLHLIADDGLLLQGLIFWNLAGRRHSVDRNEDMLFNFVELIKHAKGSFNLDWLSRLGHNTDDLEEKQEMLLIDDMFLGTSALR